MDSCVNNLPLKMSRASLDNVPECAPPAGFTLRWYQPGDEAHWLRIHLAADEFNRITPDLFQQQFAPEAERPLQPASPPEGPTGAKPATDALRNRQCYLLAPGGEVVGTGTAWFNDHFEGARWGRVHWMAVLPEFQRQGRGRALLSAVCRRLRELGHERAYLSTSTARIAAIRLYLRFGFAPHICCDEDQAAWQQVRLALPGLL